MRLRIFFIILCSIFCLGSLTAQRSNNKITITGTVLDVSKYPIANAIVMIDGQNTSSVTDTKGGYKVKVKNTASKIGIFTFGSGIIEESISGRTQIDFNFSTISNQVYGSDILPGEESVDVGYSYVKKKNLTNAVGVFDFKNSKRIYHNVYEMIQEIPGIDAKVFNMFGPVGPAYVVNGMMVSSLDDILPSTVESIVFLKDAAAAIYGSRGFGGVILIKTMVGN
jgi:TonB-dependent SusC/RagA subfamily outer membrane receptor